MSRIRTFLAIESPPEVQSMGQRLVKQLADAGSDVRWVQPENMHLTLKFLGEIEDRELHDVCQAAAEAAGRCEPFTVDCGGLGAFPSTQRPHTIWMGVQTPHPALTALHASIEETFLPLGFPREHRQFRGHITLGRTRSRRGNPQLTPLLESTANEQRAVLPADELVVYSSELQRSGPVYTVVGRCELGRS